METEKGSLNDCSDLKTSLSEKGGLSMFKLKLSITILVIFCPVVLSGASMHFSNEEAIKISIPPWDTTVHRNTAGFAKFSGKDLQQLRRTGEPDIPYQAVTVLLPPDVDLSTVSVHAVDPHWERIEGFWAISPVPLIATWDGDKEIVIRPEGKILIDGKDADIYTDNAIFPVELFGRVDTLVVRQMKLVQIFFAPYRYNPVKKHLYRLADGVLKITFDKERTEGDDAEPDYIGMKWVNKVAVNFDEAIEDYYGYAIPPPGRSSNGSYVIMTTSEILSSSNELANFVSHKEARGFTVQIVTEATWGGGIGDTAAENIRAWLKNNYQGMNIEYVLLIGNPHPNDGDVPMKICRPTVGFEPVSSLVPTDFYFAELTSTAWDDDGDGLYGEYFDDFNKNPPRGAEVRIGRIPCYDENKDGNLDIATLDNILLQIKTYENTPGRDSLWRKNVLLPMNPVYPDTPCYNLGEAIKDHILIPNGWDYHRVYDDENGYFDPPKQIPIPEDTETYPCTMENVLNIWGQNSGYHFGAVFWSSHGSIDNANDVMNSQYVDQLDPDYPGFTFQCSCRNGDPDHSDNLGYSLLKKQICVSTVSASDWSWCLRRQTSFKGTSTNMGMAYEYAERLIGDSMSAGDALNDLKLHVATSHCAWWMNYLSFNLYGCPAVGLFAGEKIYVPSFESPTIKKGIENAAHGDVVIVADGVYTGPDNRDLEFHGKAITVRSENGPEYCTINCGGSELNPHRGFYFCGSEENNSVVQGFTIKNGYAQYGSGIRCSLASPTISNNIISENEATYAGAGIFCENSSPVITHNKISANTYNGIYCDTSSPLIAFNTISGNLGGNGSGIHCNWESNATIINNDILANAGTYGGGIFCHQASPKIQSNNISENSAIASGGGIYCYDSSPDIHFCTIRNNSVTGSNGSGGGIECTHSSSPSFLDSSFSGNSAAKDGGAISCRESSSPTIASCILCDNTASVNGGGIFCVNDSSPVVLNCVISDNEAAVSQPANGGAIYCSLSSLEVYNCTITHNIVYNGSGGAMFCDSSSPTIANSILWGDSPNEFYLVNGSNVDITYSDIEGGWSRTGNINADPLFVEGPVSPLFEFAGTIMWGEYYLSNADAGQSATSPCVDTGNSDLVATTGSTRTDLLKDWNPIDMGYHYPRPYWVLDWD